MDYTINLNLRLPESYILVNPNLTIASSIGTDLAIPNLISIIYNYFNFFAKSRLAISDFILFECMGFVTPFLERFVLFIFSIISFD
jgi:hypothetical protein